MVIYIVQILVFFIFMLNKNVVRGVPCKRCSYNFRKIHRKTPALESLFNKVADLRPGTLLKNRL